MSVVISDTTPINYLIRIGEINILEKLYGNVLLPEAVYVELMHQRTPTIVKEWASNLPDWVFVTRASQLLSGLELDKGELEAISLAHEIADSILLIDERKARMAADKLDLRYLGTLQILGDADYNGLLNFDDALEKLLSTTFRTRTDVIDEVRRKLAQRKDT